ncbi:ketopantoate reductase family protein [Candidimonas humi]|jgi:2-dehydropantoate 2-reductase|uniref:2-dehydropantoate 2-reductase n=1 Tax=Candidimonas humi TaxID=683355 RepID=A0ABV8P1V7_9BURK|nr:ketopantoate reductase family protein [Candidimonas humi]MBV6306973.1 ketopantoate reductase family protein [Candidimonas humi]
MNADRLRILVVGCGAMGGIFAAHLARVADVAVLDTDAAHVAAIRRDGLRLEGGEGCAAALRAETDAAALHGEVFDTILFLVKSGHTAGALAGLQSLLAQGPLLVTLQNGMGNSEILEAGSTCKVLRGIVLDAGRYLGPGRVEHLIRGNPTWLGPTRGAVGDCARLAEALNDAGLPTRTLADPMDAVWSKLVFNSVMNPIGALLLGVNAARYGSPEVCALVDDMAGECAQVVRALGGRYAFDPMAFVKETRAGLRPVTRHAGSMALDIANGAPTEIDELTGFFVREGDRLNVPVPACRTVYRLVKGLEAARAWQLRQP